MFSDLKEFFAGLFFIIFLILMVAYFIEVLAETIPTEDKKSDVQQKCCCQCLK